MSKLSKERQKERDNKLFIKLYNAYCKRPRKKDWVYTREEFAKICGVSLSTLHNIYSGKSSVKRAYIDAIQLDLHKKGIAIIKHA